MHKALNIWAGEFGGWGRSEGSVEIMTHLPRKCQRLKRRTLTDGLPITPRWRSDCFMWNKLCPVSEIGIPARCHACRTGVCARWWQLACRGAWGAWFWEGCRLNGIFFPQNIRESWIQLLSYRAELDAGCCRRTFLWHFPLSKIAWKYVFIFLNPGLNFRNSFIILTRITVVTLLFRVLFLSSNVCWKIK